MTDWEATGRRLTALEDRERIRTVLYRYARGTDQAEAALTGDLY